jgi:DNA-binding MarR family transcriptional regulator
MGGVCAMLEESFIEVYEKFKVQFYKKIFEKVKERDGSLSAMEGFSLEIIRALNEPTVGQFADFLNISQSNATYKVNSLIKKGYLVRQNSTTDRREYHLVLSDKYYSYAELMTSYEQMVVNRMRERFGEEDAKKFDELLTIISEELMPECD